ncbi:MAG: T9SS type A sorting domain-containing protein [Bacteroidales bacterium]|jgi:photosystem II stability/assembly factor-like uncharacterized protein|nr:T9SS type A sorting domain-containing protein [Bacteroidales bacterium]
MKKILLISTFLICNVVFSSGQSVNNPSTGKPTRDNIPDHIRNTKAFKRAEWFFNQRAFPYDTIPAVKYSQEMSREINKAKTKSSKEISDLNWSSIGPSGIQTPFENWGVIGGRVRAVAVHPTDPLTIYIGAACGGIWKTTDGGSNWQDTGQGLETLSFGAIAIDPNNPDVVYAGSGECNLLEDFYTFSGKGLYKSTDGGATWVLITAGFGSQTHFSDLAVSPYNSNIVVASLGGGNVYSGVSLPNEGVWKSFDGGITWSKILDVQDASDIAFHPSNPNIMYAAAGGYFSPLAGFYISNDQGTTWVPSNTGLQLPPSGGRMQFDIARSQPNVLYAVIYDLNFNPGNAITRAFKSINGGNNWSQISAGTNLGGYYSGYGWVDQGWYDLCIAVDPLNPNHVLIGNVELHRTTNGSTFTPVRPFGPSASGSLVHVDYHKLVYAPSNPNYLYIGCDGGIYKSTDKGYTASSQNLGLETLQFYRIASHPNNSGIIIGGMQDNGSARTINGGASWNWITGSDGMVCLFNPNPDTVYTSSQYGQLYRSINGGNSFSTMFNVNGGWITPFLMHPVNHKVLYSANRKIMKSLNAGASFQAISGSTNVSPANITTLAQSRVNPANMIFGTGMDHPRDSVFMVKISINEGLTWNDVTANIPGESRWISRVLTDPWDANTMYVLRTGFSPGNKVWKTIDLGQNWTNISGDLPDLPCNDLFVDPENTSHLYVANDIGVYRSTNGGLNWIYASEGTPFVPAIDFDYVNINSTRYLRVGTHGRSIYETTLPHYCLPEGINFSTQVEIDNFQTNYPGCTHIEGNVTIMGADIANLNGLNAITSIGGNLDMTIGSDLLTSLSGLDNLNSVGGSLTIANTYGLTNLSGLNSLTAVGGNLIIGYHDNYFIHGNFALTSLTGLSSLTSIGGILNIEANEHLTSLSGIDNIASGSITDLFIRDNWSLSTCEAQSICDYLVNPGGTIEIYANAPGCNSPEEVQTACETHCLPEGITFTTQNQVDSFQVNHPGCTEIEGDVMIGVEWGVTDITNLNGLNMLTSTTGSLSMIGNPFNSLTGLENLNYIGGNLKIGAFYWSCHGNDLLVDLTGLNGLDSIGGDLDIDCNHGLTSLSGLESLTLIGGNLKIGNAVYLGHGGNPSLTSLSGLSSLRTVESSILISRNDALTSLTGLEGLTYLPGYIEICYSPGLINLTGLNNLSYIGGLDLYENYFLVSLSGLDHLDSIGGNLYIGLCYEVATQPHYGNEALASLNGLENLTSIGGTLNIGQNPSLTSLAGLDNIAAGSIANIEICSDTSLSMCDVQSICDYLSSPSGEVYIQRNAPGCNSPEEVQTACETHCLPEGITFTTQNQIDSFQVNYPGCYEIEGNVIIGNGLVGSNINNLNGLNVLTSIGGTLSIFYNLSLTSLNGLEALTSIGGGLNISDNDSLINLVGLNSLSFIGGNLTISTFSFSGNCRVTLTSLTGLESLSFIGGDLNISCQVLSDLTGLNGLTVIGGNLIIYNCSLGSFNGLENLVSLAGDLNIVATGINSFTGLNNLTSIGGDFQLGPYYGSGWEPEFDPGNSGFTNLAGLENLTSIGGNLGIAKNSLTDLTGLDNVTSIGGNLYIWINEMLTSLTGLDSIVPESIDSLFISSNPVLSGCEVRSICNYLADPNGYNYIQDNASGCNSPEEVLAACAVSVEDIDLADQYSLFPNPTGNSVTISSKNSENISEFVIYLQTGQKVIRGKPVNNILDISKLQPGMYIVELVSGQWKIRKILIVE